VTRQGRRGTAALGALAGYGTALWLLEPARANSLTVLGGLRVAQLLGLAAMILALLLLRARLNAPQDEMSQA
jgi:hypothetical protein